MDERDGARRHFALEDVGITVRVVGDAIAVESDAGLLDGLARKRGRCGGGVWE
jgi:hypothetical protein